MFEELVLSVDDDKSDLVDAIGLDVLGLKERTHLQQWILKHPNILGPGTQVITDEFDQWQDPGGQAVKDRLDILAIDPDGRLVVGELKRGIAADTTHLQAIKYAAMVSRLRPSDIADLLSKATPLARSALNLPDDPGAIGSALETVLGLSESTNRSPRIVLVAFDFSPTVTSSTVWLREQGVDITLVRFRPYRLATGQVIVSFVRIYPLPDTEEFTIGRRTAEPAVGRLSMVDEASTDTFVPWDEPSLRMLSQQGNPATIALLNLCSEADGQPVTVEDIAATAGITKAQVKSQLAGLTMRLKNPNYGLSPRAWPVRIDWQPGGVANYYFKDGLDAIWREIRRDDATDAPAGADQPAANQPPDGPDADSGVDPVDG